MKRLYLAAALLALPVALPAGEPEWSSEKRNHWAWKVPARPVVPAVKDVGQVRNPIDAFIMARLEAAGIAPAPRATAEQLIRRVTFDLTGLPPTPAEVDEFVAASVAKPHAAYESLIDRLLASPHYGERWGRHWLDLARYADSNGFEHDEVRPDAWRYRDYVIASFNADKPYDRFVREQLAGDLIAPDDPDALVATGFNLLGPDMTDASSQARRRQITLDDMTDTAGLVFLGVTVGCARCHNHKFEPISITDHYRLQAYFAAAQFRRDLPAAAPRLRLAHAQSMQAYEALAKPTRDALAAVEGPYRKKLLDARMAKLAEAAQIAHRTPEDKRSGGQRELVASTQRFLTIAAKELAAAMTEADRARQAQLTKELKALESKKPTPLPSAIGLSDSTKAVKTFVLRRGELNNPGDEVDAAPPTILAVNAPAGRDRAALADWVASPANPLTARVMVNRLWQHHFGRGIVATPSDFGLRGERPTHPELLDWLASEFVTRGWSVKAMHRLMLTSATYQQSTAVSDQVRAKDPDNRLFSRMNRLRLEGEAVRDSLLAISVRLDRSAGGPGVQEGPRRSVYFFARRNLRVPFLEPFDPPDSNQSCAHRERSTTAPQALALLNAAEVTDASRALAARLREEGGDAVGSAFRRILGRAPTDAETRVAGDFLRESPLEELCRALFNANEFVYLD